MPLLFWFVGRVGPVRTLDFYRTIAPAALAALSVLIEIFLGRRYLVIKNPIVGVTTSFFAASLTTLLVLMTLASGRRALWDFIRSAALLINRDK